jgi:cytochrome P450
VQSNKRFPSISINRKRHFSAAQSQAQRVDNTTSQWEGWEDDISTNDDLHCSVTNPVMKHVDNIPGVWKENMSAEEIQMFIEDPLSWMNEKYEISKAIDPESPMYKFSVGSDALLLFSHDLVAQWQKYEMSGQVRRAMPDFLIKLIGEPFHDMAGPKHLAWRKKAMPAFKPKMIDEFAPFIQDAATNMMLENISKECADGKSVSFNPLARRFAFEIGMQFIFGPLLDKEERDYLFYDLFNTIFGKPSELFKDMEAKDPDSAMSKAMESRKSFAKFLKTRYEEAERLTATDGWEGKYGENSTSLLRTMLEKDAIFDNEGKGDTMYKVDFLFILVLAAFETSATTLTNLLFLMDKYPKETEKVRQSILSHPELSKKDCTFSLDLLKSCNELECFIQEAMRFDPIFPVMAPREVMDENGVEIGGYNIPKGIQLNIPIKWLHQGEGSWTESMEFNPSRFDKSDGSTKAERGDVGRYNNIPFATGLHSCLGKHLALLEIRMYTTLLLRDWDFEIDHSKLEEEGLVAMKDVAQSIPFYNVYLKSLRRKE